MTSHISSIQVISHDILMFLLGGNEILLQNAGQDATTQFEDINHSAKAFVYMKDLYIGDYENPDDNKESWEEYVKRK